MAVESTNFDKAAAYYDETRGLPVKVSQEIAALFAEVGRLDEHSHVLEVGVGTGRIVLPLVPKVQQLYGLDVSSQMMRRIHAKNPDKKIILTQSDARFIPYKTHSFEATIAVHVLHLVPNWQRVMDEMLRVTKADGTLIFGRLFSAFSPLWDIWQAIHQPKGRQEKASEGDISAYTQTLGLRLTGRPRSYEYVYQEAPSRFFQMIHARCWSSLWDIPEAEFVEKVAALEKELRYRYDDFDKPIEIIDQFHIQGYRR